MSKCRSCGRSLADAEHHYQAMGFCNATCQATFKKRYGSLYKPGKKSRGGGPRR